MLPELSLLQRRLWELPESTLRKDLNRGGKQRTLLAGGGSPFPCTEGTRQPLALFGAVCNLSAWEPSAQPLGTTVQYGMAAGSRCSNPNKWAQHPHVPSSYAQDSKKRTPSVCFSLCLGCFCWFFVLWGVEGGGRILFLASFPQGIQIFWCCLCLQPSPASAPK